MTVLTLGSLSEIVHYLEEHCFVEGNVLFRGQSQDWTLLPGIARLRVRRIKGLLLAEAAMLRSFRRRSLPFLEMRPESPLDWLAVAQHHGLPTRLLDWTVDALTALWFVVHKPAAIDREGRPRPGVLWAFIPKAELLEAGGDYAPTGTPDPFAVDRPAVIVPRYVSRRIVSQGGYFTIHPHNDAPPHFAPFESQYPHGDRVTKILIPPESFPLIRHNLIRLGTNSMAIYPDLGGLCMDIAWRYSYKEDESEALWDNEVARRDAEPSDA